MIIFAGAGMFFIACLLVMAVRSGWWFIKLVACLGVLVVMGYLVIFLFKLLLVLLAVFSIPIAIAIYFINKSHRKYMDKFYSNREEYRRQQAQQKEDK